LDNSLDFQSKSSKKSGFKNIMLGLGGIIFGIIAIAIVFFVLDYLNIINIRSFFTSKQPAATLTNIKDLTALKSLGLAKPKAEKAGYKILFEVILQNELSDATGRHILASEERVVSGWTDKFGWQKNPISKNGVSRITGIFLRWDDIKETKDRYMVIKNVVDNEEIRLRILHEQQTLLYVDNLDYGPLNSKITSVEKIDYLKNISSARIDKIIKQNDIVCAYVSMITNGASLELNKDKNGMPIAESLEIRRFGGINTINDEFKKL